MSFRKFVLNSNSTASGCPSRYKTLKAPTPEALTPAPDHPRNPDLALSTTEAPRGSYGNQITHDEETQLLNICQQHRDSYGKNNQLLKWWGDIGSRFSLQIGQKRSGQAVRKQVEQLVRDRKIFLEKKKTGTEKEAQTD